VLTGRAENHLHGVDDLDDTVARLVAYRDAGADCVYAPALTTAEQIAAVVQAVGVPVNVLALRWARPSRSSRSSASAVSRPGPVRRDRLRGARRRGPELSARNVDLRGGPPLRGGQEGGVRDLDAPRRLVVDRDAHEVADRDHPTTSPPSTTGRCRKPPWIISAAA
jgi:hypothetical protein